MLLPQLLELGRALGELASQALVLEVKALELLVLGLECLTDGRLTLVEEDEDDEAETDEEDG